MIALKPNWHQHVDARSLEMHRLIAQKVRRAPELIKEVEGTLKRWLAQSNDSERAADTMQEWQHFLETSSLEDVLTFISSESEEAARMRQSSPFAGILTDSERQDIFAKYEALRS
jgi:hypothetical protein